MEYVSIDDYDESEEEVRAYESLDVSNEAEEANVSPQAPSKHKKKLRKPKSSNQSKKWMSIDDSDDGEEAQKVHPHKLNSKKRLENENLVNDLRNGGAVHL